MRREGRWLSSYLFGLALLAGCNATRAAPPSAPLVPVEPRWEGVLDPTPDLLVVVRPRLVRGDPVYGPLIQRAMAVARQQNSLAAQSGALEAMDEADEVLIAARDVSRDGLGELAVVVRGVRASIDPANLVDEQGRALWVPGPNSPAPDVRELVRAPNAKVEATSGSDSTPAASLFELPGRTWVIATGRAPARVRDTFARRATRSRLDDLDPAAPVVARISGPALVARFRALRPPGLLAPIGRGLESVTIALTPSDRALVRATFKYAGDEAATAAQSTVRQVLQALVAANSRDYEWLRPARVESSSRTVVVATPLPATLLDGLLH